MVDLAYVVVAGYAQLPQRTGAGVMWRHSMIIAAIERSSHRVLAVSTTLATGVADEFVRENMVGLDLRAESGTHRAFRDLVRHYDESVV